MYSNLWRKLCQFDHQRSHILNIFRVLKVTSYFWDRTRKVSTKTIILLRFTRFLRATIPTISDLRVKNVYAVVQSLLLYIYVTYRYVVAIKYCYFAGVSLDLTCALIGWFLVTCYRLKSNIARAGNNTKFILSQSGTEQLFHRGMRAIWHVFTSWQNFADPRH